MRASLRLALGAGCIAAVVFASVAAQSVYSWKDDKGVTHYSDSPPPKGAKSHTVAVPPPPPPAAMAASAPAPATTVVRSGVPPVVDPAAAEAAAKQRAAVCQRAQENLKVLQQDAVVGVDKDGDGKNDSVLTPDERTKQAADMQAAVTSNCAAAPAGAP